MKKLALITGASAGLGRAITIALSKKFKVGIHYFEGRERGEAILKEIENNKGEGKLIWGNLSNEKGVKDFILATKKNFGKPDILINNFGPIIIKNLYENELNDWWYILHTNLLTPFLLIKEFLPFMREKKWGRIINIGFSEANKSRAFKNIVPYAIAKSALLTLTKSIAKLEKKSGITCNIISPYLLEEGISPIKRKASRTSFDKIISLILYLCEEEAENINGKNFIIKD